MKKFIHQMWESLYTLQTTATLRNRYDVLLNELVNILCVIFVFQIFRLYSIVINSSMVNINNNPISVLNKKRRSSNCKCADEIIRPKIIYKMLLF